MHFCVRNFIQESCVSNFISRESDFNNIFQLVKIRRFLLNQNRRHTMEMNQFIEIHLNKLSSWIACNHHSRKYDDSIVLFSETLFNDAQLKRIEIFRKLHGTNPTMDIIPISTINYIIRLRYNVLARIFDAFEFPLE